MLMERQTDMMTLTVAIHNFVHTPLKEFQIFNIQLTVNSRMLTYFVFIIPQAFFC